MAAKKVSVKKAPVKKAPVKKAPVKKVVKKPAAVRKRALARQKLQNQLWGIVEDIHELWSGERLVLTSERCRTLRAMFLAFYPELRKMREVMKEIGVESLIELRDNEVGLRRFIAKVGEVVPGFMNGFRSTYERPLRTPPMS